jgi:hypothetical protein
MLTLLGPFLYSMQESGAALIRTKTCRAESGLGAPTNLKLYSWLSYCTAVSASVYKNIQIE